MKLNFTSLATLLIVIILFSTACNKNNNVIKPVAAVPQPLTTDMVSSHIALNLAQSLSGTYGGIDIKSGINKPAFATEGSSTQISRFHALSNSLNSLCGFFVDSTLSYDANLGDTIKSHADGTLKFYFNCDNGISTGYTANDIFTTTGKATKYSFVYAVNQNYQTTSLNTGNSLLSIDGNLKSDIDLTYDNTAVKQTVTHDYYVLDKLIIDLTKGGDITSGSAIFTSTGSNNYGTWSFNGTITFLGNHKADILINGKTYHANLTTGVIS
jgi:hypothetical protein